MTTAVFYQKGGLLYGFCVSGHTDTSGSDSARLVCAAVSSAVYLAANTITDVIGDRADVSVSDGELSLLLSDNHRSQDILLGLKLHLDGLKEQYPEFIQLKMEVQHDA